MKFENIIYDLTCVTVGFLMGAVFTCLVLGIKTLYCYY